MYSILQDDMCHFDFVYLNIHLDRYNVRVIKRNAVNNNNYVSHQHPQSFYPNIFNVYENCDETHFQQLSFLKFCQQFE